MMYAFHLLLWQVLWRLAVLVPLVPVPRRLALVPLGARLGGHLVPTAVLHLVLRQAVVVLDVLCPRHSARVHLGQRRLLCARLAGRLLYRVVSKVVFEHGQRVLGALVALRWRREEVLTGVAGIQIINGFKQFNFNTVVVTLSFRNGGVSSHYHVLVNIIFHHGVLRHRNSLSLTQIIHDF